MFRRGCIAVAVGLALSLPWSSEASAQMRRVAPSFGPLVVQLPQQKIAPPRLSHPERLANGQRLKLSDGAKPKRPFPRPRRPDTTDQRPDRADKPRVPRLPPVATGPDTPKRPDGKPGRPGRTPPDRPDNADGSKPPIRNKMPPIVLVPPLPTRETDPPRRVVVPKPPVIVTLPPPVTGGRMPPVSTPALPPRGPVPTTPPPVTAAIGGEAVANEVVFAVAAGAAAGTEDAVAQRAGLRIIERLDATLVGLRIVRCQRAASVGSLPNALLSIRAEPAVVDVQANFIYRPSQAAAAPATGLQYALAKLDLDSAHAVTNGRGVRIAIIDSGIDHAHADLSGISVERFDALGGLISDTGSHGTAIAGIIAARGTIRGIAPAATLLAVRAFPSERAPSQVSTTFVLLKSLEWSIANRAGVVNLSLAGPRDPLLEKAVTSLAAKGVLLVAAAGNNGDKAPPAYPAAYAEVIAVTAIDAKDQIYAQANRGDYIALAAPGVDVLVPTAGNAHALQSGTSFAAAHISGVLALMLERDPSLSAQTARRVLLETAVDLGNPGRDSAFGAGRSSAAAALSAIGK